MKPAMHVQTLSTFLFFCVLSAIPVALGRDQASPSKPGNTTKGTTVLAMTPLQRHVAFFDRDKNGLIYPKETFEGMRAIGVGAGMATVSSLFIHAHLGPLTKPPAAVSASGKNQSKLLPIYVENISKGKHISDTGAYDPEGRFVPQKFEEIFTRYAKTKPNALTSKEVDVMLLANQDKNDTKGQLASKSAWKLLFDLGKDKDGLLQKDIIREVYDGTLFYKLEKEKSATENKNNSSEIKNNSSENKNNSAEIKNKS